MVDFMMSKVYSCSENFGRKQFYVYVVSVIQYQVEFFQRDLNITLYYLCLQDGYEEILSDEEVSFQVELNFENLVGTRYIKFILIQILIF